MNNNWFQKAAIWLVIALVLFTVFKQFDKPRAQEGVTYSQFMDDAKGGKIKRVEVQGRNLLVTPNEGGKYTIISPGDIWMVGDLMKYGVQVTGKAEEEQGVLLSALYYLGPTLLDDPLGTPKFARTWEVSDIDDPDQYTALEA